MDPSSSAITTLFLRQRKKRNKNLFPLIAISLQLFDFFKISLQSLLYLFIFFYYFFCLLKTISHQTHFFFLFQSLFLCLYSIADQKPKALPQLKSLGIDFSGGEILNEMMESKAFTRRKGFYVRMKLFPHKNCRAQEKSFFIKYYKWVLWVSLSLYFFTSYYISHNHKPQETTAPIPKTHLSNSKSTFPSRALIESSSSTFLHQVQQNQGPPPFFSLCYFLCFFFPYMIVFGDSGLLKEVKVFVYDLPPKYNVEWLSNERCSNHLFASEVAIHRALLNSDYRTFDPLEADFFFVPVYVSCNFSTINGFPAIGHARSLIASAVAHISSHYSFWNRTNGSDHVFVASHDFASCFHTMVID